MDKSYSLGTLFAIKQAVEESVMESIEAREIGAEILANHRDMNDDELANGLLAIVMLISAKTASKVATTLIGEEVMTQLNDELKDLESITGDD
jgi:transcriptional regulator NrdR family protein